MNTSKISPLPHLLATLAILSCSCHTPDSFKDCPECPEMVAIPGGTFLMGSPENEKGRAAWEGPQRRVTVTPMAIGKFDVTRGQWAAFVTATNRAVSGGCAWSGIETEGIKIWQINPAASWRDLGFEQDDSHPVVCVSWYDAVDYVTWLSEKTGEKYRLPTEAEWEYAARAGSVTPYPWGDHGSRENANYGPDSGFGMFASGRDQWMHTSPAGAFEANAFGLFDMHGNVMQFVQDCYSPTYAGLPQDGSAYKTDTELNMNGRWSYMNGTSSCAYRIIRGGDYGNPPEMIRSASRNWAPIEGVSLKDYRSAGLGFRVARSL